MVYPPLFVIWTMLILLVILPWLRRIREISKNKLEYQVLLLSASSFRHGEKFLVFGLEK